MQLPGKQMGGNDAGVFQDGAQHSVIVFLQAGTAENPILFLKPKFLFASGHVSHHQHSVTHGLGNIYVGIA